MCGIVGFISNKTYGPGVSDAKAFYNLLLADTVRGGDGTGMFWIDDKDKPWYYKDVGPAASVVDRSTVEKFLDDARFAVGHNRAATLGALDKDNTHPFVYDHVLGVHNGTVSGWASLGATEATMDSMAIYECLNNTESDEEAVTEFLAKINGAYALVWYDRRIKSLRFARNSQRPMNLILTKAGDLWFGSELRMLEWCLDRNSIKMAKSWSLDTNCLVTVPVHGGELSSFDYLPSYSSSGNYWTGGTSYPTYGGYDNTYEDAWWKDSDSYGNWRNGGYTTTSNYVRAIPRKIDVTSLLSVERELPDGMNKHSRDSVAKAIRLMLGREQGDVLSRRMDEYIGDFLLDSVPGAVADRSMIRVPAYVVKINSKQEMLGYLEVDGAKVPLIMNGHCVGTVLDAIKDILDGGHVAEVPNVLVYGLTLYHQADVAYRAGPATCKPEDIKPGPEFKSGDIDLRVFFGGGHPESIKDNGACDWNMWGNLQGGLI